MIRYFILVFIFCLASPVFSQDANLHALILQEELVLDKLYAEQDKLIARLEAQELPKGASPEYADLKSRIKIQKNKLKSLKKAAKQQVRLEKQRAEKQVQAQQPVVQPSVSPAATVDPVKVLKKEIKALKKRKKEIVRQLQEQSRPVDNDHQIIIIDEQIASKQASLNQLLGKPVKVAELSNSPIIQTPSSPASAEVNKALIRQKKDEIKRIKKLRREKITLLTAQGISAKGNAEIVAFDRQIDALNTEIKSLKRLPVQTAGSPPAPPETTPTHNTTVKPAQVPVQPGVVVDRAALKSAKRELKALKKRKKEIAEQMQEQGRYYEGAPELVVMDEKITAKNEEIAQIKAGVITRPTQTSAAPPIDRPTLPPDRDITFENPDALPVSGREETIPQIGLSTILFDRLSANIDNSYHNYLNFVAKQMKDNPNLRLRVDAYVDNSEKQRIAMQLTNQMAENVKIAFLRRGITEDRLIARAQGSRKAIGDNKTFLGQARNRRVELRFTY